MLDWNEFPKVDQEFMNQDHEECLNIMADVLNVCESAKVDDTTYDSVDGKLEMLREHLVEHFQREEEAMEATGFPPYYVHKTEHDTTLQELQQVVGRWLSDRNIENLIRYISRNLMNWLETHALMMDTVTAQHISRHG